MGSLSPPRYLLAFGEAYDHATRTYAWPGGSSEFRPLVNSDQGRTLLLASLSTPTTALPDGSILIGRVFAKDGTTLTTREDFPTDDDPAILRQYILNECWGEYVLFQFAGHSPLRVTRDPSGAVPCLYAFGDRSGFVASDISMPASLGIFEPQINWTYIRQCLRHTHLKNETTGFARLKELLPGYSISTSDGTSIAQEWSPWHFVRPGAKHRSPEDAASHLRHAVALVTRSLAELDGSLLLELSGGLDSSVVCASLGGVGARVVCSTLTTPVPGADERLYAAAAAGSIGAPLLVHQLSSEEALIEFPPPACAIRPRVWALQYAVDCAMESAALDEEVQSHFSGAGGDAVFGYIRSAAPIADAFRDLGARGAAMAARDLSEVHGCTVWKAARLAARKHFTPPKPPFVADDSFLLNPDAAEKAGDHPWFVAPPGAALGDRERIASLAGNQLLRDGIGRGTRRPFRMPLLSQPVVETCLRTPSWMWFTGGRNRSIARLAFDDLLPQSVLNRRSKGTFVSYSGTVYRRRKQEMARLLLDGELQTRGLLDADALLSLFDSETTPANAVMMRIFDLCMIENWVRHYS